MGFDDPATIFSVVLSMVSLFGVLYGFAYKWGQLTLKVDTMWDFLIGRAKVEGFNKGMLGAGSTFTRKSTIDLYPKPLLTDVLEWYRKEGHKKGDRDLFIAIEQNFGDKIVEEVCIPHNLQQGACITSLIDICKGNVK